MIVKLFITSLAVSTALYLFLRRKTKMPLKHLYVDNIAVILLSCLVSYGIYLLLEPGPHVGIYLLDIFLVGFMAFTFTMIRFWRTPVRRADAPENSILSPADGNIIYIEKLSKGEIPVSVKKNMPARLSEISKTDLLDQAGWLIGINMTPFDVHKNCAPVRGQITFSRHIPGIFLSLKDPDAKIQNERHTYIINQSGELFGVVQIASRLVRRIDSYVDVGQEVKRGQWIGMIRFGSQVDLIIPDNYTIQVAIGDQVYAGKTIMAGKDENTH
jgi:phosphatidylserine decarboxylase